MGKTTEERLTALEEEVARLKSRLDGERPGVVGRTRPGFLDTFVGIFAEQSDFDDMMRRIDADRDAERKAAGAA